MSLPPGFLDELRTRTSLSRVVGRKVTWDQRKSNQGKGDLWAPCPFHQEKTASFHVDDRQGFYYCFGCHAKGDIFRFVQETENLGFMEAVEVLAREAGMTMPAADPRAQERADRRTQLAEVMEKAVAYFRLQLKTAAAAAARDYLAGRKLAGPVQERFELGFAPDGWRGLWEHLTGKGVAPEQILAAGLAKPPTKDGAQPYDTFRNRIMFPIRDPRGKAIAFGGRAMDPNDQAKYLNSPETELFDKGRTLYNHGPARELAGKGKPLIVAEGYIDVIALTEAGFAAVAPLGTAITEDQLALMWRIADEPVIMLDGDTAGQRAARRVIDLALPRLEAGKGLRFATLPEGLDPDDLIRGQGAAAVQAVLESARPMVRLLWERETGGRSFDSPERKAALDRDLREALKRIKDPSIRAHYGEAVRQLRQDLFRPARPAAGPGFAHRGQRRAPVLPTTRASLLAAAPEGSAEARREALVLAVLLIHPGVIGEFESALERLEMAGAGHDAICAAILRHWHDEGPLRAAVARELGSEPVERLFAGSHLQIAPALRPGAGIDAARACLAEEIPKIATRRGAALETQEAAEALSGIADEGVTWRVAQAAEAKNRALRAETEDKTHYDTAPSGARVSRDEKAAFDGLLDQILGTSPRKPGH